MTIDVETLRTWLEEGRPVTVLMCARRQNGRSGPFQAVSTS